MWIHITIFTLLFVIFISWKVRIIPENYLKNKEGRKIFFLLAIIGNILGMILSYSEGNIILYSDGHKMEKKDSSYEEGFQVIGNDGETIEVYIKVPKKEDEKENTEEIEVIEEETEEAYAKKILKAVKQYNEKMEDPDYYYLPASIEDENIQWKTIQDTSGALIAALFLIAAIVLMILKEREGIQLQEKRREELLRDYPGLIMKFTLLIQAGMTARKAFQKIAADYKRRNIKKEKAAYEEILNLCYELDTGVSEAEAYRRFGERCGQVKYKTFSTLLIQNLQKGSRYLADILEQESTEAWEERKRKAKVLGETAATKLIIPMMLMLIVVMAVIMIPACLMFYSGM